ncbi:MAG TPA: hypothetical protein VNW93_14005, partial [Mycobacterium sp.]|nr:hypothetical protein [Mycobacterium sp.]
GCHVTSGGPRIEPSCWKYHRAVRIGRMANRGPDDYVSATAAAHRLGGSTRTLRRYTQDGRLPAVPVGGGSSVSATWM